MSSRPTPAMFATISRKPVAVIHHVARLTGDTPCVDIAAAVNGRTIVMAAEPVRDGADVHHALLQTLKQVWAHEDGGLAVYGLPAELREIAQLDPEFRGIEFPATVTGRLAGTWEACRASFAIMQETLYVKPQEEKAQEDPVHLTIATDASKQKCSNVVGIAAVSTSGRIATSQVTTSKVLEGEFAAIELALSTVRGNVASVEVLTDSQKAARNLNIVLDGATTQRPGSGPEEVKCLRRLARVRRKWIKEVASGFDAILLPTVPIMPPNAQTLLDDGAEFVRANLLTLRNTRIGNLLGLPAITLPTARPACGLMAMCAAGQDARLLRVAAGLERALAG